ncbi:MAG: heat-inducible transcriptional repressor HrcA [Syntrophobacteraceae bacterium]|nr:heat-inducible transcriptional repressor HrcA [Syntrophobacteraceae bacterium]
MTELTRRDQQVLEAVITDYIQTGEPVGSRVVARRYGLDVSSATIRNVMADLEELGFLYQPHTSAGRVPTDRGLRFYLDFIMKFKALKEEERRLIQNAFSEARADVKELLHRASRVLSDFCKQAGVVLWPKLSMTRFKHIELIRLRARQIMVILISKSGLVHHRLLEWEEDIHQHELDKYSRYLNELLEDVPLGDIKARILEGMRKDKTLFDQLFHKTLEMTQRVVQSTLEDSEVYIEGRTNLLSNPEFAQVERMRKILAAFEDKTRIIRLLDRTMNKSSGVRIVLGSESDSQELSEISLVSSPYRRGDTMLGVVGVIGPLRMDYSRIIPVVEFTAAILSGLLEDPEVGG